MTLRHIILLLIAAACTHPVSAHPTRAVPHAGSSPARAITILHPKHDFDASAWECIRQRYPEVMRVPYDSDLTPVDRHGRVYSVAITFTTRFHGKRTMYFKTTWKVLTGKA